MEEGSNQSGGKNNSVKIGTFKCENYNTKTYIITKYPVKKVFF